MASPSSNASSVVPSSSTGPKTSPQGSPQGGEEVPCPFCTGEIKPIKKGRTFSAISGLKQRTPVLKLPTGLLSLFTDKNVSKKQALKGPCKSCGGKGTIKDPAKIANAAAEEAAANHKANAEEITKEENKLAPAGGNRYTIIQGSDLLEVGLGMNDVPSYAVLKGAGRRNKKLASDLSSQGAPMFFEGAECNYIQGVNPPASPGGHYFIKCSNKFSVMAGAQGIDLTTGGPITISGGITRISGPEITIGTQTGPLSLEGEVVNINGKSVEIATSDGDLCVRGNISSSSNMTVGGHLHSESISFVGAKCIGTKDVHTDESGPSEYHTGPAFYGSAGGTAQSEVALDLAAWSAINTAQFNKIKNLVGPAAQNSLGDKIKNMAYQMIPYEKEVTGWIIPGTQMVLSLAGAQMTVNGAATSTCPCNQGGSATGVITIRDATFTVGRVIGTVEEQNIDLHNFPHSHVLPDQKHDHTIRLPDIDCSADTAEQLRSKVVSPAAIPAPFSPQESNTKKFMAAMQTPIQAMVASVPKPTFSKY